MSRVRQNATARDLVLIEARRGIGPARSVATVLADDPADPHPDPPDWLDLPDPIRGGSTAR